MFQIFLPKDFFSRQGVFCSPYRWCTDRALQSKEPVRAWHNAAWQKKTGKKAKDILRWLLIKKPFSTGMEKGLCG
jgi:hypothetical protein